MRTTTFLLTATLSAFTVHAQRMHLPTAPPIATKPISLLEQATENGRNKVVLHVGMRTLSGDVDSVSMFYRDPSPSGDNGTATVLVDGKSNVVAITACYEREGTHASFQVGLDGFIGSVNSYGAFVGASYHLVNNDGFTVKAGARLGYSVAMKKLGEIVNNGLYFYVDGQYIYNPRLSITANDHFVALTPNVVVEKHIAGPVGLLAGIAGNFGFRSKSTVTFQGQGFSLLAVNNPGPIEVDMSDANLVLTRNGTRVEDLGLRYTGLSLTLGLSYNF